MVGCSVFAGHIHYCIGFAMHRFKWKTNTCTNLFDYANITSVIYGPTIRMVKAERVLKYTDEMLISEWITMNN